MRRLGPVILAFVFLAVVAPAMAQELPSPDEVVVPTAVVSLSGVHPGGSAILAVVGDVLEGWHVNAHLPSEEYLIPTVVELSPTPGLVFQDGQYPKGEMVMFEFAGQALRVYEGRFITSIPFQVEEGAETGKTGVSGVLSYQACNDRICLPPADVPFRAQVVVAEPGQAVSPQHPEVFDELGEVAAPQVSPVEEEGGVGGASPLVFGLIFMGGLALNLTPCVYPLIPITIAFFGGQSERSARGTFGLSGLYVLGMATTYSVLGVIVALTGGLFGAALQNPWVLGFVALVMVLLALSQFGVYEFRLPGTTGIGSRRGVFGAYLMGLVVGLVAAPCIGPFVVLLLATVAQEGDPVLGFWKFFALSLGLGTPYLFLGAFSGALTRLPRAGEWMEGVKHLFGLVLVVMAAYFLGQALPAGIGGYMLPVALVAAALALLVMNRQQTAGWLKGFQYAVSLAAFVAGVWFLLPDWREHVPFQPYTPEAVSAAASDGRPVLIDFTAEWCVPCKEYDHKVFNDQRVVTASTAFLTLKADLTRSSSREVKDLVARYDIFGPPTIVFIDSAGKERLDLRLVGYVGPDEFLQRMQAVDAGGT